MDWIKLLPHEEGIEKIGKEALSCFVLLFWMYLITMWAISSGIVIDPREFFDLILSPKAILVGILAVIVATAMRKSTGGKASPYRYGWVLTVIGMLLFPLVSLLRSYLLTTLFFVLWYYLVIWTFSWEAAPKKGNKMKSQKILLIATLSLIISTSALGWTVVSIALGEMEKEGTSGLAGILTNLYVDILIPAGVFLYFGYFLGKSLGRENLESIGIPTLIGSFVLFLLLTTPLDSILTPWEVSPEGVCQKAPYMPEEYLLTMAFMASVSSLFIVGWAFATARDNKPKSEPNSR